MAFNVNISIYDAQHIVLDLQVHTVCVAEHNKLAKEFRQMVSRMDEV